MSRQSINLGTIPTGVGGDTPRSAFTKTEANIIELYTALGSTGNPLAIPAALPITKGGTGATSVAAARTAFGLKSGALADIVGLVSAGAIMESGSNASGAYVKFQNGLAIVKVAPFNLSVGANAVTVREGINLPIDFVGDYHVTASGVPTVTNTHYGYPTCYANLPYQCAIVHFNGPAAQTMVTRVLCVGFWKAV